MAQPSMGTDAHQSGPEAYHKFIGPWSARVAFHFVNWLSPPSRLRWLDVGCGTGVLTAAVLDLTTPRYVCALDISHEHVSFARESASTSNASFEVGDADALPHPEGSFDTVVSGLTLNLVSEPRAALREMKRVLEPGGTVAAYVWDFGDGMRLFRTFWDAAIKLDPRAADLDQARQYPWCQPEGLRGMFEGAALENVASQPIDVSLQFSQFDDYWSPFLSGHGRVSGYAMSLDASRREVLREHLRANLPVAPDGSLDIGARAWAIRGTRAT